MDASAITVIILVLGVIAEGVRRSWVKSDKKEAAKDEAKRINDSAVADGWRDGDAGRVFNAKQGCAHCSSRNACHPDEHPDRAPK